MMESGEPRTDSGAIKSAIKYVVIPAFVFALSLAGGVIQTLNNSKDTISVKLRPDRETLTKLTVALVNEYRQEDGYTTLFKKNIGESYDALVSGSVTNISIIERIYLNLVDVPISEKKRAVAEDFLGGLVRCLDHIDNSRRIGANAQNIAAYLYSAAGDPDVVFSTDQANSGRLLLNNAACVDFSDGLTGFGSDFQRKSIENRNRIIFDEAALRWGFSSIKNFRKSIVIYVNNISLEWANNANKARDKLIALSHDAEEWRSSCSNNIDENSVSKQYHCSQMINNLVIKIGSDLEDISRDIVISHNKKADNVNTKLGQVTITVLITWVCIMVSLGVIRGDGMNIFLGLFGIGPS